LNRQDFMTGKQATDMQATDMPTPQARISALDPQAMPADESYDVAIIGYGPAGVVAAALLGQAGLRVHVCDRLAGVHEIPRALSLDHEVMRLFQQLGVAEAVAPFVEPFTPSEFFGADGRLIRRMTMVDPPYPQAWTPSMVFTQPPVERALRDRVASLAHVTVALQTTLLALAQDADGVSLTLQRADGQAATVRARWAIGCDGGSSTVRGLLGIELEDLGFDEPWLVVDVLLNDRGLARLPATSVQYCEPERPCTMVIGPGCHRRWEISLKAGEDLAQAATPEGTWRLLSRWITPEDGRLWRQASYRFHALVARRWRVGGVFVAGDAAHMQPPFLGQGMCQGLRDVANLAWKLVAVHRGEVRGPAAESLLESYGLERQAHVRELTTRLKAIGAVICERDPLRARERDEAMLKACGGVVRDTPRQDVIPGLTAGWLSPVASPGRGQLFPQPWLADGRRMDDAFGRGWRLVLDASLEGPVVLPASACGPELTLVQLGADGMPERDGVVAAWMARQACHAALLRPDHIVWGTAVDVCGAQALWVQALDALHHGRAEIA
jgi:3-(3-hydroxy-phenyl)propionate hydroxylase